MSLYFVQRFRNSFLFFLCLSGKSFESWSSRRCLFSLFSSTKSTRFWIIIVDIFLLVVSYYLFLSPDVKLRIFVWFCWLGGCGISIFWWLSAWEIIYCILLLDWRIDFFDYLDNFQILPFWTLKFNFFLFLYRLLAFLLFLFCGCWRGFDLFRI